MRQKLRMGGKKNILKMESNLQKYDLSNNNDPLLIAPITDLNFNNIINNDKSHKTNLISIGNFFKVILNLIINPKKEIQLVIDRIK